VQGCRLPRNVARRRLGPNSANEQVVQRGPLPRAQGAQQVVVNTAEPVVGVAKLRLASGRELDDVAAAVRGIAATRDQPALLELVEKSDDIAWIQAEGVREGLLARRSLLAEELQRDEVTGAKAARLKGDLESTSTDAGEVLEKR
jgi:hypothetical protein